ncbi:hypothetical protein H6758_05010 [Candidatus Nomurabacteria bacterium]|nr:hypothetical protein [Candidatus Nomurabacteria bacterium]
MAATVLCCFLYVAVTVFFPAINEYLLARLFFRLATILFLILFLVFSFSWKFGKPYELSVGESGLTLMSLQGETEVVPYDRLRIRARFTRQIILAWDQKDVVIRCSRPEQLNATLEELKKHGVSI